MRPPAAERQRWIFPARHRDLRARGNVLDQRREHVETSRTGDGVQVVEHQHQRALECTKCAPDPRNPVRPRRATWTRQRLEHLGGDRLNAVNCSRDVSQEHHRVVVSAVERNPSEWTRIGLGPLRKQRRLAVPGGCDHGRERQRRRAQLRDDVRLRHGPGPGHRRRELHVDEVERNLREGHRTPILEGRWGVGHPRPAVHRRSQSALFHTNGMRRTGGRPPRVDGALDFSEDNPGGTG